MAPATTPVIVDGGKTYEVFSVGPGTTAAINNLTIQNGSSSGNGGGVSNQGTLTISNSTLVGNAAAAFGGAVANSGALTLINDTFTANSADATGGAVYNTMGTANGLQQHFQRELGVELRRWHLQRWRHACCAQQHH